MAELPPIKGFPSPMHVISPAGNTTGQLPLSDISSDNHVAMLAAMLVTRRLDDEFIKLQ